MIEVILSVGLAFLATVIAEPHFIQYMKMKQLGQTTLDEGPSWHKAKVELQQWVALCSFV